MEKYKKENEAQQRIKRQVRLCASPAFMQGRSVQLRKKQETKKRRNPNPQKQWVRNEPTAFLANPNKFPTNT